MCGAKYISLPWLCNLRKGSHSIGRPGIHSVSAAVMRAAPTGIWGVFRNVGWEGLRVLGTEGADSCACTPHLALTKGFELLFEFFAVVGLSVGVD